MTLNNAYSTSPLNNQYSQQPMLHKMESQAGNNSTGSPTTEETPFSPQQALSPKGANTSTARFTGSQVGVREMESRRMGGREGRKGLLV